ncbi:MAG TPA: hypothetical protein VG034_15375 [Acidimicrobiia bacterium]|jgi:hypothetical protein|nr:hypothetical protein [Acidimicrobiia bacterium]
MTDAFADTAHALARACGMPGYTFAVISHPIAPNDDETLRRKAADAVVRCVELLTTR